MKQSARESDHAPLSTVAVDVLLSLASGPKHGYAVKLEIEARIGGDFMLGSGSLYQALQRLERRGLIAEHALGTAEDGRRGRVYALRPEGRRVLATELGRMQRVLSHARRRHMVIGPERA